MTDYVGGPGNDTFGGTANDDIAQGNGGDDTLGGRAGNDILAGGEGADTLQGGVGDDTLYSADISPLFSLINNNIFANVYPVMDTGREADSLRGGDGNDTLFAGYGDTVDGGDGRDTLYLSLQGATSGVTAHFNGGQVLVINGATIANVEAVGLLDGSEFDDDLSIDGQSPYASFDVIRGLGGKDHLRAGYMTGQLFGGDGDDIVDGRGSGYIQTVDGGAGNDILYAPSTPSVLADGGDGDDTIYSGGLTHGGAGNDKIYLNYSNYGAVSVFGDAGDDFIAAADSGVFAYGGTGADVLVGARGDDHLFAAGTTADATLDTGLEHDVLSGGEGNDVLSIGYGDDADGGTGTNKLILSLLGMTTGATVNASTVVAGTYALGGSKISNIQSVEIHGTDFADTLTADANGSTLYGEGGGDTLIGGRGADLFYGGAGADKIMGGAGSDIIYLDQQSDVAAGESIDGGSDIDTIQIDAGGLDISAITITRVEAISVNDKYSRGNTVSMTADQLAHFTSISASAVYLTTGGKVSLAGDKLAVHDFYLSDAGNSLSLVGVASGNSYFNVIGGMGNDTITGGGEADVLISGGGRDTLSGGAGDDLLEIGYNSTAAGAIYDGGTGTDTLSTLADIDISHAKLVGLETLDSRGSNTSLTAAQFGSFHKISGTVTLTTGGVVSLKGMDLSSAILNLSASGNTVNMAGNLGVFAVQGGSGNDTINGSSNGEYFYGGGGNDTFAGHGGGDDFDGGDGVDTVDFSWATVGVTVDLYNSTQNLGAAGHITLYNVENIIGTKYNDILAASDAGSVLTGGSGDDTLFGGLGVDSLLGGAGTDSFIIGNPAGIKAGEVYDGGSGVDTLHLNFNSDSDLSAATLIRVEYLDQTYYDYDTKLTAAQLNALIGVSGESFTLTTGGGVSMNGVTINAHVFNLSDAGNTFSLVGSTQSYLLTVNGGAGNDIITGGALDDTINGGGGNDTLTGGAGNDAIDGGTGADRMYGGAGNDTFVVDNAADRVYEAKGDGTDTVLSSVTFHLSGQYVENLTLTGNDAINGTGNQLDNVLIGNAAANYLVGGDGNDQLHGGLGMDKLAGSAGNDQFWFDTALGPDNVDTIMDFAKGDSIHLDANIFGVLSGGALADTAFYAGTAAHDADDRIIYDAKSGSLWYDADGSSAGAAVLFAHVNGHAALTAGDFFVA